MRNVAVVGSAVVCVGLLFALSGLSTIQKVEGAAYIESPRERTSGLAATGSVGFIGVTAETFETGVGALVASRACNDTYPQTRLCEWADVFRAIPPPALGTDVLIAPNYEVNPETTCLAPDGGLKCKHGASIPAACCGTTPMVPVAALFLSPSSLILETCSDQFVLTATALGPTGTPVPGVLIFFEFSTTEGGNLTGSFNPVNGVTDINGEVSTTLAINALSCSVNCINTVCTEAIRARDQGGLILSEVVPLIDNIP